MENKETTTLVLTKETKANLDKLKVHERETYDQLLERMAELGLESLQQERVKSAREVIAEDDRRRLGGSSYAG